MLYFFLIFFSFSSTFLQNFVLDSVVCACADFCNEIKWDAILRLFYFIAELFCFILSYKCYRLNCSTVVICGNCWVYLWCTAGMYDLRPSEGQPNESIRVQLAGTIAPHQTDAWEALGRTCQSNLDVSSLTDIKAWWWFRRLCEVTVQFTILLPNWFEFMYFETVRKSDSVFDISL